LLRIAIALLRPHPLKVEDWGDTPQSPRAWAAPPRPLLGRVEIAMVKIAEIEDVAFREALERVDGLIADGDYTQAARLCAETYLKLLAKRPDFIPPPPDPRALPQFRDDLPQSGSRLAGGTGPAARPSWPNQGGLKVLYYEAAGPQLRFEKERFGLAEATSYFEFLIDEVVRDQRTDSG